MNATEHDNTLEQQVLTLGAQARVASAAMAKASASAKNRALRALAQWLRESVDALQIANAHDLDRARASGLA